VIVTVFAPVAGPNKYHIDKKLTAVTVIPAFVRLTALYVMPVMLSALVLLFTKTIKAKSLPVQVWVIV